MQRVRVLFMMRMSKRNDFALVEASRFVLNHASVPLAKRYGSETLPLDRTKGDPSTSGEERRDA